MFYVKINKKKKKTKISLTFLPPHEEKQNYSKAFPSDDKYSDEY